MTTLEKPLVDKQMDLFTKQSLLALATEREGPCVSLYMPTERRGPDTQQGPIRLKNLLGQVETELAALGQRTPAIQQLLAPAQALVNNNLFWQYQSDGLALLLAPGMIETYRLPLQLDETVVVNDRFYLKPLLAMLSSDDTFYLLALRQGGVRLLQGSRFSLAEIELGDDVPTTLAEALKYDDFEEHLRFHIASRPSTGSSRGAPDRGAAMYHGQGGAGDDANTKEQIVRFFRALDNGVRDLLTGSQQPPLVLAGIDYLRGLYRQVNQYNTLLDEEVVNDPEALTTQELHQRAWAIVEPLFTQARQDALATYHHLAGSGDARAAQSIEAIASAAYFQRVDTLLMPHTLVQWGTFDAEANQVDLHPDRQPGDQDLIDFAALHTLLNGGAVYLLNSPDLPAGAQLAAILRY
jgi:Bacterial archaeo-eukaryotic release factor family 7